MGETITTRIADSNKRKQVLEFLHAFRQPFLDEVGPLHAALNLARMKKDKRGEKVGHKALALVQEKYSRLWRFSEFTYRNKRWADELEEIFVSSLTYIGPATNDSENENEHLSYIRNPQAIGFDYGDHGAAWGITRWLAERFGDGQLYCSNPNEGSSEDPLSPHEPMAETACWWSWASVVLEEAAQKAGL
jgi:hypothetical protein